MRFGPGPRGKARERAAEAAARRRSFDSDWHGEDGLITRRYASYEAYLEHQAAKLERIDDRLRRHEASDYAVFVNRFQTCASLRAARSVLCLGARLGTEVRALHRLGFFAIGVDLNPGQNNPHVLPGDFHHLQFSDGICDAIYTNALDHTFDLRRLAAEANRLLRPGGVLVADVVVGFAEGFTPGPFEATHWTSVDTLIDRVAQWTGFGVEERRPVPGHGDEQWVQIAFRKPAASAPTSDQAAA